MGIFDIFKKKLEPEKINFEELEDWINLKKESLKSKKENFLNSIKNLNFNLISDLKKHLEDIKKVNLFEKKIEDKIKLIVKENLNNYIIYLDRLIKNLEALSESNPNKFLEELNTVIFGFEKKSSIAYEKATFVVGDLGKIKDRLDNFFQELKKVVKDNTDYINETNTISIIELKLIEIEEISENKKAGEEELKNIMEKGAFFKESLKSAEKNIEKIEKSPGYLQEMDKKNEYQKKKEDFERELYRLKEMIDFKVLASLFHSDYNKMKIINSHRDNFKENFKVDSGEKILNLIKEGKLDTTEILDEINGLNNINKEIKSAILEETNQNKLKELNLELKKLNSEIHSLKEPEERELKKQDKYENMSKELTEEIKKDLEKINVKLIVN